MIFWYVNDMKNKAGEGWTNLGSVSVRINKAIPYALLPVHNYIFNPKSCANIFVSRNDVKLYLEYLLVGCVINRQQFIGPRSMLLEKEQMNTIQYNTFSGHRK